MKQIGLFEAERINDLDFQSLMHLSIFGNDAVNRIIPTQSVPAPFGNSLPKITINKVFFCDIYNSQVGVSNLLWDSGAPFIVKLLFDDAGLYDPEIEFVLPTTAPETTADITTTTGPTTTDVTTTTGPTTTNVTTTTGPTTTGPTTTDVTTTTGPTTTGEPSTTCNSTTCDPSTTAGTTTTEDEQLPPGVFTMQQGIMDLLDMKVKCVFTLSGDDKVICPLDKYIKAYADYIRTNYNTIAASYEQPRDIRPTNRNVFNMLTRDIKFQ
jgi:hypothetical protein